MSNPPNEACSVAGCNAAQHARTLCMGHYQRQRRYGDAFAAVPIMRQPRFVDLVASSRAVR